MDTTNTFNLLQFPSNGSKAFTDFVPRVAVAASPTYDDSPPRKTARLGTDADHSVSRAREKAKGLVDNPAPKAVRIVVAANPPQITEEYLSSLLIQVQDTIVAILQSPLPGANGNVVSHSYDSIYQATRALVLVGGRGKWVYEKLCSETQAALERFSKSLVSDAGSNKVDWLRQLVEGIEWFEKSSSLLQSVLTYLDRAYLAGRADVPAIKKLQMQKFKANIFESAKITFIISRAIKEWSDWEREMAKFDESGPESVPQTVPHPSRPLVTTLLKALHRHGVLESHFLTPYLNCTRDFYAEESNKFAGADALGQSPAVFVGHCHRRLEEEKERNREVLGRYPWTWPQVNRVTEQALIVGRLNWLKIGLDLTIDARDREGLRRVYVLFGRVNHLKPLCESFKSKVHQTVEGIVSDLGKDEEMVNRLLEFKRFIDLACNYAFRELSADPTPTVVSSADPDNDIEEAPFVSSRIEEEEKPIPDRGPVDKKFKYAAVDAFQSGFRKRPKKPAELIAKYIDKMMRKGQGAESDEQFSERLDSILGLYRFTQDKDVFRTFYHRSLAKRLILGRSASDDFEKVLLKRLKEHYDPEFGMAENMFKDLAVSRDFIKEYYEKNSTHSAKQLSVMVLQQSNWPFAPKTSDVVVLPTWMQINLKDYSEMYNQTHKGHKLIFDHSLGTMHLKARFDAAEKELSVSLYQGVVLLLFNDQDDLNFSEIQEMVQLDEAELRRTLQSLACGNKRILRKRPPGKDVNDGDVFSFNGDFTDLRPRVHVNSIQVKETVEESHRTQQFIDSDRKHYLDAAIVRVMKAKKTISHQMLLTDTIDSVKNHFVPDVKVIKERIEQLIEQEYIKRDDGGAAIYVYVA